MEDGEEVTVVGAEDCLVVLEGPIERTDLLSRGVLFGGHGILHPRRVQVDVRLLHLEGEQKRVDEWEGAVAEAEKIKEGLVIGEEYERMAIREGMTTDGDLLGFGWSVRG